MNFLCLSDLHGNLPSIHGYNFDAILIGGDITPHPAKDYPRQVGWLNGPFREWLELFGLPATHIIGVAGNHDWIFQAASHLIPQDLPWTYLQDSSTTLDGLLIYGSPWQPEFCNWAFNATEDELSKRWGAVPEDTDIMLLHGPPYQAGDYVLRDYQHVGSRTLRHRIEVVQPKLVVCGHIHDSYGEYAIGRTKVVNASVLNEHYRFVNEPVVVEVRALMIEDLNNPITHDRPTALVVHDSPSIARLCAMVCHFRRAYAEAPDDGSELEYLDGLLRVIDRLPEPERGRVRWMALPIID